MGIVCEGWLRDLGRALGFDIYVAANDRARESAGGVLGDDCLSDLPPALATMPGCDAVRLIDVIWIERQSARVAAAFEVEHTTSIYSGIVRLLDLALGGSERMVHGLFLVAPTTVRRKSVRRSGARHFATSLTSRYAIFRTANWRSTARRWRGSAMA